jgi:hypothetical protein
LQKHDVGQSDRSSVMSQLLKEKDYYLSSYERFERERTGEPTTMREMRRKAIVHFAESGFPTTHDEDWKYTNIAPIVRVPYRSTVDQRKFRVGKDIVQLKLGTVAPACHGRVREWPLLSRVFESRSVAKWRRAKEYRPDSYGRLQRLNRIWPGTRHARTRLSLRSIPPLWSAIYADWCVAKSGCFIETIGDSFAQCAYPHKQRSKLLAYINAPFLKRGASNVNGEINAPAGNIGRDKLGAR